MSAKMDRFVDVFDIRRDANHFHDGFARRQKVVVIRAAHIAHYGDFRAALVGDFAQIRLFAEPPRSELGRRILLLVSAVAQFDVVHSGVRETVKHVLDECLVELPIVHEAAIADAAVENFDLRSEHVERLLYTDSADSRRPPSNPSINR